MSEEPKKQPVTVKRVSLTATWAFEGLGNDRCSICTAELTLVCLACANNPIAGDSSCTPAWGVCGHSFHFHCISRWLTTRNSCPLCDKDWDWLSTS